MADFSTLIATLQATIKTNYRQEITGQILQDDLLAMVNVINQLKQDTLAGYAFHGAPLANGASVAVTQNTFFLVGKGTYTINGISETTGEGISALVYDSVDNEVRNYALFAYDTTPTENSRNAITSGAVAAALAPLATKEDVEAVEQEVAQVAGEAGLAEAVIDTDNAGTEQEFTFRKSGGDGGAYYRKIKGKTLGWNQLVQNGNFEDAAGWRFDGNGSIVNNEATVVSTAGIAGAYRNDISIISGHYYFVSCYAKVSEIKPIRLYLGTNDSDGVTVTPSNTNQYVLLYGIIQASVVTSIIQCNASLSVGETITIQKVRATDLTLATLADLTAAQFEALYPDIYPYNPGTLISNDAEAVETTGVNQWDEEWEEGGIDGNGDKTAQPDNIRTKNYNPCAAGTTYYVKATELVIYFYDSNKTMVPYTGPGAYINGLDITDGNTFVAPNGACYFLFRAPSYGTTYNHDICINLSNPAINGQYFPYWKRTLQLGITTRKDTDGNVPFADGMKGAGTAADWADKVGGEKRIGRVDLGSLEWTYNGSYFSALHGLGSIAKAEAVAICARYTQVVEIHGGDDKVFAFMSLWSGYNYIHIKDTAYSDPVAFKTAMSGVVLDYPLATPVPFTWAEPLNLGVKVDENGTERAVAPEGATAPSAPFVADTTYTMSVARMVEKLQNL